MMAGHVGAEGDVTGERNYCLSGKWEGMLESGAEPFHLVSNQ